MKKILFFILLLNTFGLFYSYSQSGPCNVNIKCEEGNGWLEVASSIVRFGYGSSATGVLINNARRDRTPYILTAAHCVDYLEKHQYDSVIFLFNYQSNICEETEDILEIDADTLRGMELIAYCQDLDFALIKLKQDIPQHWNIHFAGWTTLEDSLYRGVGIHHPSGDLKKISTSDSILLGSDEYWISYWKKTTNGFGITETGSSGSALFDSDSLVIGVLSRGFSSCQTPTGADYYIRFSVMYDRYTTDTKSLKFWLDPDNLGITMLKGMQYNQTVNYILSNNQEKLIIYPNPCRDILHIKSEKPVDAQIFNNIGQLVSFTQKNNNINTSNLKSGFYWIRINDQTFMFAKIN